MDIVLKAIIHAKMEMKGTLKKKDIEYALYLTCDNVHAECNRKCPVFALNGNAVPLVGDDCITFKDGKAMLAFINKKRKGC